MSRRYRVTVDGVDHDVALIEKTHSTISFELDGAIHTVSLLPLISTTPQAHSAGVPALTPIAQKPQNTAQNGEIVAPMPGVVVAIKVKEGDTVKSGDILLSLEAMKMENNIAATKDGTIASIEVEAGQEVENNQLLIKIQ